MNIDEKNNLITSLHKELAKCKESLFNIFEEQGWDSAFFDINIRLEITVDDTVIQIKEKWKALEV